jgi:hypothetical protein
MTTKIDKTMLQPMLLELQNKIEQPNERSRLDASALQGKSLDISGQCFFDPKHVSTLVILLLSKTQGISNGKKMGEDPLSNLQLKQLPKELSLETFLFLPVEDLLKMRRVCKDYRDYIDSSPKLQTKIAYDYLVKRQPKANISLDDLKMFLTDHKLSVQINGALPLWKLTKELSPAIPWISHLIIKDGKKNELTDLFKQLKQSKRLTTLYLLNCQVDSNSINALQSLIPLDGLKTKSPVLYLCNLTPVEGELPQQLLTSSPNVVIIDANKASEYSIERVFTKESDLKDLKELDSQVENENLTGELILKKMQEINPVIMAGIISSIWHSKLTSPTESSTIFSKDVIQNKVFDFVADQPHHYVVGSAVKKNLDEYQTRR